MSKHIYFEFKINRVYRKGDAIFPLLLHIVFDTGIGRSEVDTPGIRMYLKNVVKSWLILMTCLLWEED
jgi:hypothetical protein